MTSSPVRERIIRAAISRNGAVYHVPQPGRHHDVFRLMSSWGVDPSGPPDEQGFLTDTKRFVDRKEGLAIAKAAGQIIEKCGNPNELYSEDLW